MGEHPLDLHQQIHNKILHRIKENPLQVVCY